jgi:MerR family transcriptional regulator, redox-sensitive transcriptional activator SoxR
MWSKERRKTMVAEKVRESGMTIGEVARQVGIATSAIRYYEEINLLPPPARVNGRRRYDWSAVQRLCVIEYAQQAGFTLGEIRELFFGFAVGTHPTERWKALAQRKLEELEEQSRRIQAAQNILREGIRCGCLTIEQCTVWLSGLDQSPSTSPNAHTPGAAPLTSSRPICP